MKCGIETVQTNSGIKKNFTFPEEIIIVCLSPSLEYEIVKERKGDDYRSQFFGGSWKVRVMALINKQRGWTKRLDPRESLKGREDMGRPTCKVQGRGDLTEWAGCPCKKDIQL